VLYKSFPLNTSNFNSDIRYIDSAVCKKKIFLHHFKKSFLLQPNAAIATTVNQRFTTKNTNILTCMTLYVCHYGIQMII
jgi:hypothetical protein